MPKNNGSLGTAKAQPTKEFFVRMLTRDIDLQDAVLDLLDNCIDGILRSGNLKAPPTPPYESYKAVITMAPDHFMIEDNCGGIPIELARKYAFTMGRPPQADADNAPPPASVGMYGIGMKRAIFKLGADGSVESRHDDTGFVVKFSPEWMQDPEWKDLPISALAADRLTAHGTRIEVRELNEEVSTAFSDPNWISNFRKTIAQHYSVIIAKGFSVTVGSPTEISAGLKPISAEEFKLLQTEGGLEGKAGLAPYVYVGQLDGVQVEIYAGLYRKLLSEDEAEVEEETRGSADNAGWTVVCNDRVVIWKDKTRLTGWGEATVPNYHGQFIAITGIVIFRSDDPKKLPLTTTKRGIDASSAVYLQAKDFMRDATKSLTSFTNKWKRFPDQREEIYLSSKYVDLPRLREQSATLSLSPVRKLSGMRKFEPKYPEPVQEKTSARVTFVAAKAEIALLGRHFFEDAQAKASDVGEAAFNEALKSVTGSKK